MSKLGQLLSYLEREDVSAVVFSPGKPVQLQTGSRSHPLTVTPLNGSQIRKFFAGTAVSARIPAGVSERSSGVFEIDDGKFHVTIQGAEAGPEIVVRDARRAPTVEASRQASALPPHRPGVSRSAQRKPSPRPERPPRPDGVREPGPPPPQAKERRRSPAPRRAEPAARPKPATPKPAAKPKPATPAPAARPKPATPTPAAKPERAATPKPAAPRSADPQPKRPSGGPAQQRLADLIRAARKRGASDVHLVSGEAARTRVAGDLEPSGDPVAHPEIEAMVMPLLETRHTEQLTAKGYTDLAVELDGAGRLRLNVCRQRTGLKACFRLVGHRPPTLDELGLPDELMGLTAHHQGLVVVSGPNGHGKTTTMASLVDLFNASRSVHIITVEDPVEFLHPVKQALVTQREVGTHTRSFPTALAASLREDPDVIAIGELRDQETVEMALAAAETGHLVIATMSTPSAAKTLGRMIDMFPPDDQPQVRATLAGTLKLILSQRLVKTVDGRSTVAAFEMITGNVPLWSLIRDDKLYQLPSLLQRGRNFGMIRLEHSLRDLLKTGTIREEDALALADDPRALQERADPADPAPPPQRGGLRRLLGR